MSTTATAHLAYGVDFGGELNGWQVKEDIEEFEDLADVFETAVAGIMSLEVLNYGFDLNAFALVVKVSHQEAGWHECVDIGEKLRSLSPGEFTAWDALLDAACKRIGLTPLKRPHWFLTADYG